MTLPDTIAWQLFAQTLALVLTVLVICLPLGTVLAALLWRTDVALRRLWLGVLAIELFLPMYVQAAAWDSGFGVTGWFTTLLGGQNVWLQGFRGAATVHVVASLPWVVLIVGCGLWLVEPELEEEALLHASQAVVLLLVSLRRALPAVGVAGLWLAVMTTGEMTATDLYRVRTFTEEVYTVFSGGAGGAEALVAIVPLLMLVTGMAVAAVSLLGRLTPRDLPAGVRARPLLSLGSLRLPLSIAVAALMCGLTAVPLGNLIHKSGGEVVRVDGGTVRQWSATKLLERIFGTASSPGQDTAGFEPGVFARFGEEMWWSLQLALLAATAATIIGLALAWFLREPRRGSVPLLVVLAVTLALPGPIVAVGLIWTLNRPEIPGLVTLYDQTLLAPWLALLVRTLPWTTLVLWLAVRSIPRDILDASAIEGAGPITRLLRIVLPMRWPAIALGWLVAFVMSLGDMTFTIIVRPPGVETLSVRIFRLIHAAADNEVAAVCLVIVTALVALTAAAFGLWRVGRVRSTSQSN